MEIMPDVMHLAFQVLASIFASVIIVDTAITGAEVSSEAMSLQALLEKYLELQFQHPRAWTFLIDTLVKILSDAKPKQASPPRSVAIALKVRTDLCVPVTSSSSQAGIYWDWYWVGWVGMSVV